METLLQDIRYAMRGLRRAPGFTLVALLTLALGIGVNSAIFGIVNAVLFRPLPVERPNELVDIYGHAATSSAHETNSWPNYLDYRQQNTTVSALIAYSNFFAHASIEGSSDLVVGELVSDNYFGTLGVRPALGRTFSPDEYNPGASPVAVLSNGMWRTRFGGDPNAIGREFRMNGRVYTVIGVAPSTFSGMMPAVSAQMWIPTAMAEEGGAARKPAHFRTLGRQHTIRAARTALVVDQGPHEARRLAVAGAQRVRDHRLAPGDDVPGDQLAGTRQRRSHAGCAHQS
jgi:hypothetical protein